MKKSDVLERVTELRELSEAALADIELYKKGKKNEIALIAMLVKRLITLRKVINQLEYLTLEHDVWAE